MAGYWLDRYDWRPEVAINAYDHHRVDVDGVPVRFMHRPGVGPAPLILTHASPWTCWPWSNAVDPLADSAAYDRDRPTPST